MSTSGESKNLLAFLFTLETDPILQGDDEEEEVKVEEEVLEGENENENEEKDPAQDSNEQEHPVVQQKPSLQRAKQSVRGFVITDPENSEEMRRNIAYAKLALYFCFCIPVVLLCVQSIVMIKLVSPPSFGYGYGLGILFVVCIYVAKESWRRNGWYITDG